MYWTVHLDGGPRRVNHAAVGIGEFIYSFGGYCSAGDEYGFNEAIDVHVLNTNTLRWSLVNYKKDENGLLKYPNIPFQRYGHTVVAYKNKIYMWGGRNDESLCKILYCFDPETLSWSRPKVTGEVPGARDGHSACIVENCMYIFGGFITEINEFSCDVHCLNFDKMEWKYVQTFGVPPTFRDFHTSATINGRMYIFGGRGDQQGPYYSQEEKYCNEIVYLDLKTKVWHRPATTGKVPVGRRSHSMFIYNELIFIFGGYNGQLDQHFNDLYAFNPRNNCWILIKPHCEPPAARRRQVCIVKRSKMFLFGGTSPVSSGQDSGTLTDNNDMHILDFDPSLKTLSMLTVLKSHIDITCLPEELKLDIRYNTLPNTISRHHRSINQTG
ncbi:kelch domain-containing protein 3 [Teleopsis dalmanni]|uniref:kelch domain-containing protein 3 n=1 Tax=Teleopsis dalmanni TaxID=139649 RepID=UPI0018CD6F7D|nr:kelch domain-containing protein 3 [Teleopsis dalmanni]